MRLSRLTLLLLACLFFANAVPFTIAEVPAGVTDVWAGMSRKEVLHRLNDSVNPGTAIQKYGSDFDAYWAASGAGKTGKFAEAETAVGYRRFAQQKGLPFDVMPTGLWDPAHPYDLVVRDLRSGAESSYQMKLGFNASISAVSDAKYAGGTILTTPDTLAGIREQLAYESAKATRRGLPFAGKWAAVEEALAIGRLTDELPGGYRIATRVYISRAAERYFSRVFVNTVRAASGNPGVEASLATVPTIGVGARVFEVTLKSSGMAAAGFSLYRGLDDIDRYRLGKVDGMELACRLTVRYMMAEAGLYLVFAAETGPVGWVVVGGIFAMETSIDVWNGVQDERFRRTLLTLEREDRYAEARAAVLADLATGPQ